MVEVKPAWITLDRSSRALQATCVRQIGLDRLGPNVNFACAIKSATTVISGLHLREEPIGIDTLGLRLQGVCGVSDSLIVYCEQNIDQWNGFQQR